MPQTRAPDNQQNSYRKLRTFPNDPRKVRRYGGVQSLGEETRVCRDSSLRREDELRIPEELGGGGNEGAHGQRKRTGR